MPWKRKSKDVSKQPPEAPPTPSSPALPPGEGIESKQTPEAPTPPGKGIGSKQTPEAPPTPSSPTPPGKGIGSKQTREAPTPAASPASPPGDGIRKLLAQVAPDALDEPPTMDRAAYLNGAEGRPPLRLDLCTDFGPPDEDKPCNQDAAGYGFVQHPAPGIIVALADGVSNSPYSEYGARLAVRISLAALQACLQREKWPAVPSPDRFQTFFDEAIAEVRQKFSQLWNTIEPAPDDFVAPGWRPDIFKRAVQEKNLFVTTLLLAVILEDGKDACRAFYAHVGDGGISFCRGNPESAEPVDALTCDDQTALDAFLGPDLDLKCFPKCFFSDLGGEFVLALATDGIARGVPLAGLLPRWSQHQLANQTANASLSIIEAVKAESPELVMDNLSLAFVSRTAHLASPPGDPS